MYAVALAQALAGAKENKKIAANFLALLEKNGDMKKASEIIRLAEVMLLKKTGNKKITLETARAADTKDLVKSFVKRGDVIEEKINPAIIAGVKIIADDKQLDLSLLHTLNNIF